MSVPILDDAYMQRRAAQRRWEAHMAAMRASFGLLGHTPDAPDTPESLRELYATDKLTLQQFTERLEKVL